MVYFSLFPIFFLLGFTIFTFRIAPWNISYRQNVAPKELGSPALWCSSPYWSPHTCNYPHRMARPWQYTGGLFLERQISDYLLQQMMDIHWRSKHMIVLIKFLEKRNPIIKASFPQYTKNTYTKPPLWQSNGEWFYRRSWRETFLWTDSAVSLHYSGGQCWLAFLQEQYYYHHHYRYSRHLLTSFSGFSPSPF